MPTRWAAVGRTHEVRGVSAAGSSPLWGTLRGHDPGDGHGTDGNERLTALAAAVLFVLLAAEGVTIFSLSTLLTAHVFIGVLLIPPVLLKLSSTGYRFVRYYLRDPAYRAAGPPATPLRMLAPILILLTLVLFGSGVALVITGSHHHSTLMQVHKVSFILWLIVAAIHILYYLARVPRFVGAEVRGTPRGRSVANRGLRFTVLAGALVVGLGLAIAFVPLAHTWERGRNNNASGNAQVVQLAHARAGLPGAGGVASGVRRPSLGRG
jgi:hypothetical protein